jgi:hypothetical protein
MHALGDEYVVLVFTTDVGEKRKDTQKKGPCWLRDR